MESSTDSTDNFSCLSGITEFKEYTEPNDLGEISS
jgi:hypothetical protein